MKKIHSHDFETACHLLCDAAALIAPSHPEEAAQITQLADLNYSRYQERAAEEKAAFLRAAFKDEAAFQADRAEARAMFKRASEAL